MSKTATLILQCHFGTNAHFLDKVVNTQRETKCLFHTTFSIITMLSVLGNSFIISITTL